MEDHTVPDNRITASSGSASRGRLNHYTHWIPKNDDETPWIKINLGGVYNVSGLIAQGAHKIQNGQVPNIVRVKYFSSDAGQPQDIVSNIKVNIPVLNL